MTDFLSGVQFFSCPCQVAAELGRLEGRRGQKRGPGTWNQNHSENQSNNQNDLIPAFEIQIISGGGGGKCRLRGVHGHTCPHWPQLALAAGLRGW